MSETKSGYGWCQSCGALVFNNSQCHKCSGKVEPFCVDITLVKQAEQIKELEAEMQNVANQLMDLYNECADSTEPKVYGPILGLHERLEKFLKG